MREWQEWDTAHLPPTSEPDLIEHSLQMGKVRPGLADLIAYASAQNIPVEVVSNGRLNYIRPILERAGLPVVAPKVLFRPEGRPRLEFPGGGETCERNGLCKCARIWQQRRRGQRVVFVGDGISDYCAAGKADVLFARDSLASYCASNGLPYLQWRDFDEVLSQVRQLSGEAGNS